MKVYNKPEIETLALEMIDVITASGKDYAREQVLAALGGDDTNLTEMDKALQEMQTNTWSW